MRFFERTGPNYVGFRAPIVLGVNTVWTLPDADGTAGQVLSTDGNKVLSFVTDTTGGGLYMK